MVENLKKMGCGGKTFDIHQDDKGLIAECCQCKRASSIQVLGNAMKAGTSGPHSGQAHPTKTNPRTEPRPAIAAGFFMIEIFTFAPIQLTIWARK